MTLRLRNLLATAMPRSLGCFKPFSFEFVHFLNVMSFLLCLSLGALDFVLHVPVHFFVSL